MILNFQELSNFLPENVLIFNGSQVILNFSELTDEFINLESSCVKPIVQLMQCLADLTTALNSARTSENPSKSPIVFVSKDLIGTPDAPEFEFILRIAVDTSQFANNLIDPTND